jgi:hypothetical protein
VHGSQLDFHGRGPGAPRTANQVAIAGIGFDPAIDAKQSRNPDKHL